VIRVAKRALAREAVHEALLREGFSRVFDPPQTGFKRTTEWTKGEGRIGFITSIQTGSALFVLLGPERAPLAAQVERITATEAAKELIDAIATSKSAAVQARGAFVLHDLAMLMRYDDSISQGDVAAALCALLQGSSKLVNDAALRVALSLQWAELDAAVGALAERRADLGWVPQHWQELRAAAEQAARRQADAEAKQKLFEALPALVSERRWDEALSAATAVFDDKKKDVPREAWRARALSLIGLGRLWPGALFAAGWSIEGGGSEAQAALHEVAARLPDDESDLTSTVDQLSAALDDAEKTFQAVEAVYAETGARKPELAFVSAKLRLRKSYSRALQRPALALVESATKAFPSHVASRALLAHAQSANDDRNAALASYRTAIELARTGRVEPPREAALTRFDRRVEDKQEGSLISAEDLYRSMLWLTESEKDYEAVLEVTTEMVSQPDVGPETRAHAHYKRAMAATGLKQHERAVEFYQQAIAAEAAAEVDKEAVLRFNLACELAKLGRGAAALEALAEAILLDKKYADDAREDDYFEALWDTSAFIRVVAPWAEPPTVETVTRAIERALGMAYRGEGKDALREGYRAVSGAEILGDDALLARALDRLGSTFTYHASPTRAVAMLQRAVALAEQALADDPQQRAQTLHSLGAAHHAAGQLDEAEARYRQGLALREALPGAEHLNIAISYGDLARLASTRGRADEAEELMQKTITILEASLEGTEGEDQWDALVNLALVQGNRVSGAVDRGLPLDRVFGLAEDAITRFDAIVSAGARIPSNAIQRLRSAIARALPSEMSDDVVARVNHLGTRLLELEEPDPRVRAERLYWANLRMGVRQLRERGATDVEIAQGIGRAVRGQDPGEPVASHPAFANLSVELANRLSARTDLVMVAMALDMAISGHEPVDKALESLEGFAIANASGERADLSDEELDDLDDDEDYDDE
jgi:hypothetical protein